MERAATPQAPEAGTIDTDTSAGFDAFYRDHLGPMVRLAHVITGSNAAAEDLAHDAFVKVRARFDSLDHPAAYLKVVVINECRMLLRRERIADRHAPPVERAIAMPPELDHVWTLLTRLPERRRIALVLRYYQDLDVDQIAAILECRPATVRSLIRRGLASLKEVLADDDAS